MRVAPRALPRKQAKRSRVGLMPHLNKTLCASASPQMPHGVVAARAGKLADALVGTFDRLNNVLVAMATGLLSHRMVARLDLQWLVKSPGSKCKRMPEALWRLYCGLRGKGCLRASMVDG